MDERDYKAMNEELKSADEILGKNTGMTFDEETYLIQTHFEYVIKSMEEYASQFQKQLKEKEEEIERLNSELQRKFIQWENQKQAIKNYQEVVIKHFPAVYACSENLDEELTKSKEMNDNIGVLLRNANDNSDRLEKWGNELNEKLNRAISAMTKTVQTLSFHGLKSNELNDFLTEYQNSKK